MTAILSHGLPSILQPSPFDSLPEVSGDAWCSPYLPHMHMSAPWSDCGAPLRSMQETDLTMFQTREYEDSYPGSTGSILSPELSYLPEPSWETDVEMPTPPTTGFPNEHIDTFNPLRHSMSGNRLNIPGRGDANTVHSPQSSVASPMMPYAKLLEFDAKPSQRPTIHRSTTAPDYHNLRKKQSSPVVKRSGSADEAEDDDYAPNEDSKRRGRKRQRMPHTAVERRYRENLNAHLDRLRQNVPALNSKRAVTTAGGCLKPGDGLAEGVKPSKCEILNGAIEHIGALSKDNASLESEVKNLRARLDELERERWYGNVAR